MKGFRAILKNYFLTGLLVILPIFITGYVIWLLIKAMDVFLKYIPQKYLPETYLNIYIPGLGLILVVILILVVGVLTRNIAGRRVLQFWDNLVDRIPLARIIYSSVKQLLQAFFFQNSDAFQRVALVEYPRRGIYVLGFITGESKGEAQEKINKKMINVFIPTTPNPTSGFYILVPEEDLTMLDMSVEDAFKLLISGGLVSPDELKRARRKKRDRSGKRN
ncbi:MAG: DUF502 domain-containing protein [Deltaproteobacteria bacterium]|nr:DUF502 domain-containing protein [Deltaproteobacteria bacterium]